MAHPFRFLMSSRARSMAATLFSPTLPGNFSRMACLHRFQTDQAGDGTEGADHDGVGDGPADDLQGDLRGRNGLHRGRGLELQVFRALFGVDQHQATGFQAVQHRHRIDQVLVLDDQIIGLPHLFPGADASCRQSGQTPGPEPPPVRPRRTGRPGQICRPGRRRWPAALPRPHSPARLDHGF